MSTDLSFDKKTFLWQTVSPVYLNKRLRNMTNNRHNLRAPFVPKFKSKRTCGTNNWIHLSLSTSQAGVPDGSTCYSDKGNNGSFRCTQNTLHRLHEFGEPCLFGDDIFYYYTSLLMKLEYSYLILYTTTVFFSNFYYDEK